MNSREALGQASNHLRPVGLKYSLVRGRTKNIRVADAKEVGVGNPAEETCCHPNAVHCMMGVIFVNMFCGKCRVAICAGRIVTQVGLLGWLESVVASEFVVIH